MKNLSIILAIAFGGLSIFDLITGNYQIGILELVIAVHNFSDYLDYVSKDVK